MGKIKRIDSKNKEIKTTFQNNVVCRMFRADAVADLGLSGLPILILKDILIFLSRTSGNPIKTKMDKFDNEYCWISYKMGKPWAGINAQQFRRVIDRLEKSGAFAGSFQAHNKKKSGSCTYFLLDKKVLLKLIDADAIIKFDLGVRIKGFIDNLVEPSKEYFEKSEEKKKTKQDEKIIKFKKTKSVGGA